MRFLVLSLLFFFMSSTASAVVLRGGLQLGSFDYREDLPSPQKSEEKGWIPKLHASLTAPLIDLPELTLRFSGEMMVNARTQYNGTDLKTSAPVTATDTHSFVETQVLGIWAINDQFALMGGLEYDYWDRFLSYGSGYREIYTWISLPVGAQMTVYKESSWDFKIEALIKPMLSGRIKVIFSETVSSGNDSEMTLGNHSGYRLQGSGEYWFTPELAFYFAPYYERSGIDQSNSVYNSTPGINAFIREPASTTEQFGFVGALSLRL